jgi:hypothetical protein
MNLQQLKALGSDLQNNLSDVNTNQMVTTTYTVLEQTTGGSTSATFTITVK